MRALLEGFDALAFERQAYAAGEWWRLATGLLSHWSGAHLLANLAAITLLAATIARSDSMAELGSLLGVTLPSQMAALAWMSEATQYRGSSGIAWALGTFVALRCLGPRWRWQLAAGAAALLLAAAWGAALPMTSLLPACVLPDPAMHAAGAAAGFACALLSRPATGKASAHCCA